MKINKLLIIASISIITVFTGCVESQYQFSKIPPGMWRGVLYLTPTNMVSAVDNDEVVTSPDNSGQLPFNFEVVYDTESDFHLVLHNADERIKVEDITFGRDRTTAKDTLTFNFPVYDTQIKAVYEEKVMEGHWIVNYKDNYKIKFKAWHGDTLRFKKGIDEASVNLEGNWDVKFEPGTDGAYPALGVFNQQDNYLTGTFQTETGDYRFLEGEVRNEKAYLSCFDGAHAFLFESKMMPDGKLSGVFLSGTHYTAAWEAERTYEAKLGDPFALTTATAPLEPLKISFPNPDGKMITLNDPPYQDKIKVIEIMGTWCPNCRDATDFLKEFKQTRMGDEVAILSIAFERYKDDVKNLAQLKKYKNASKLPWEVVLGGNYRKSEASKSLPQLDKIRSYPTLLFLDQSNTIRHIHTGFSGPATENYNAFKTKFNQIINTLLDE